MRKRVMKLRTIQIGQACLKILSARKDIRLIDIMAVTGVPRSSASRALVTLGKAHVVEREGSTYHKGDSADDYSMWWKESGL